MAGIAVDSALPMLELTVGEGYRRSRLDISGASSHPGARLGTQGERKPCKPFRSANSTASPPLCSGRPRLVHPLLLSPAWPSTKPICAGQQLRRWWHEAPWAYWTSGFGWTKLRETAWGVGGGDGAAGIAPIGQDEWACPGVEINKIPVQQTHHANSVIAQCNPHTMAAPSCSFGL
jgi:hypothetical protein